MRHAKQVLGVFIVCTIAVSATPTPAAELTFYKIASGKRGGIYFPVAGAIAKTISNPPGSKNCEQGGNCGVPGLTATPQSSGGSVANVDALLQEKYDAAIAQSDITYWSFTGTGPFRTRKPNKKLCVIASLYKEEMHLLQAPGADIGGVMDIRGKRVALGKRDSGSLIGSQLLVRAYGLTEGKDFTPEFVDFNGAQTLIKNGKIDAFIYLTGYPNPSIAEMARGLGALLVPIDGDGRKRLADAAPFYTATTIPAGIYPHQSKPIETVAVTALWISRVNVAGDLTYNVTKAFWTNKFTETILAAGPEKAASIGLPTAFDGVSIPLCAGAQRFYKEIGMIK